jgi:hypothetical protein
MIPKDALNRIRSVTIHYEKKCCIFGFSFFDKDGALLWKIGNIWPEYKETVVLAVNEVIVGVVAKPYPVWQSAYTDF